MLLLASWAPHPEGGAQDKQEKLTWYYRYNRVHMWQVYSLLQSLKHVVCCSIFAFLCLVSVLFHILYLTGGRFTSLKQLQRCKCLSWATKFVVVCTIPTVLFVFLCNFCCLGCCCTVHSYTCTKHDWLLGSCTQTEQRGLCMDNML